MWKPRYYYIMRNITTDKHYVGQTTQDISEYLGSGTYWKTHCKSNGGYSRDNIQLMWYRWFEDEAEAKEWLKQFELEHPNYYLQENKEWANQVAEGTNGNPFIDDNPGPTATAEMIANGTHNFLRGNRTKSTDEYLLGSEKHKALMVEKYGVENAMQNPEVAKRSAKRLSESLQKSGIRKGANNPKATSIVINNKAYSMMSEASSALGISMHYIRKAMREQGREITLDLDTLNRRTKRYGRNK